MDEGMKRTTVPLELNGKELFNKDCGDSEMIIYGYYPMMISAQCIKKTCGTCDHQSKTIQLKDRYGNSFAVKSDCQFCYSVIYNSVPTGAFGRARTNPSIEGSFCKDEFYLGKQGGDQKDFRSFCGKKEKDGEKCQDLPKGILNVV